MNQGPIFIVGSPRSGSSVLAWSLAQSDSLWTSSESDFFPALGRGLEKAWRRGTRGHHPQWLTTNGVSRPEFFAAVGDGLDQLVRSRSDGRRWVDQTPFNISAISTIARLFPGARFLVLFRDGRQAVPSIQALLNVSFERAALIWRWCTNRGLRALTDRGVHTWPVCYEELVMDTEVCLGRVMKFLGEALEPGSVDFIRERQPINSSFERESSLEKLRPRWREWGRLRRMRFELLAGAPLRRVGYEDDRSWLARRDAGAAPAPVIRSVTEKLEALSG